MLQHQYRWQVSFIYTNQFFFGSFDPNTDLMDVHFKLYMEVYIFLVTML